MKNVAFFFCVIFAICLAGCGGGTSKVTNGVLGSISAKVNEVAPGSISKTTLDKYSVIAQKNNLNESQLRDVVSIFIKCGIVPERMSQLTGGAVEVHSLDNECEAKQAFGFKVKDGKLDKIALDGRSYLYNEGKVRRHVDDYFFKKDLVEKVRKAALKKYAEELTKSKDNNIKDIEIAQAYEDWKAHEASGTASLLSLSDGTKPCFDIAYDFTYGKEVYGQGNNKFSGFATFLVSADGSILNMTTGGRQKFMEQKAFINGLKESLSARWGFINAEDTNFRAGPGTNSKVIGVFDNKEKVATYGTQGEWTKVQRLNGQKGWVYSRYVNY